MECVCGWKFAQGCELLLLLKSFPFKVYVPLQSGEMPMTGPRFVWGKISNELFVSGKYSKDS